MTHSGVNVTPVTSSASTIETSGTTEAGKMDGESGGGVGGVGDRSAIVDALRVAEVVQLVWVVS